MMPIGENASVPAFDTIAWLGMYWHGAHSEMKGTGDRPDTGGSVRIVEDCPNGQFSIAFCSTACLRQFLNNCVDELEKRIK